MGYHTIHGDPAKTSTWDKLTEILEQGFEHQIYGKVYPVLVCIDSGGHHTNTVYNYCNEVGMCVPIKGTVGIGKLLASQTTTKTGQVLYLLASDSLKTRAAKKFIYTAEENNDPDWENNELYFPSGKNYGYSDSYFKSLASEQFLPQMIRGVKKYKWTVIYKRNEAFDILCYSIAALSIFTNNDNMSLSDVKKLIDQDFTGEEVEAEIGDKIVNVGRFKL